MRKVESLDVTLNVHIGADVIDVTAEARDGADGRVVAASRMAAEPGADVVACAIVASANLASSLAQRACVPGVDEDERDVLVSAALRAAGKIRPEGRR